MEKYLGPMYSNTTSMQELKKIREPSHLETNVLIFHHALHIENLI